MRELCIGTVLHVCCGQSKLGDLRIDVDESVGADMMASVRDLPIKDKSFDTVLCDPPYSFYNRFKWICGLADVARQRLILATPLVNVRLGHNWNKEVYVSDSGKRFIRVWYVFTFKNRYLEDFGVTLTPTSVPQRQQQQHPIYCTTSIFD